MRKPLFIVLFSLLFVISCKKEIQEEENIHYEKCKQGNLKECLDVNTSSKYAEESYKIACNNKEWYGCVLLANIYDRTEREKLSGDLYKKACEAGDKYGCEYLNEKNIKECSLGNTDSCTKLEAYLKNKKEINVVEALFFEYPTLQTLNKIKNNCDLQRNLIYDRLNDFPYFVKKVNAEQAALICRLLLFSYNCADGGFSEDLPGALAEIMNIKPLSLVKAIIEEKINLQSSAFTGIASTTNLELVDLWGEKCRNKAKKIYNKKLDFLKIIDIDKLSQQEKNIIELYKKEVQKSLDVTLASRMCNMPEPK